MTNALPNRRDEAWKYSDLRAALTDAPAPVRGDAHIIARLARTLDRSNVSAGAEETLLEQFDGAEFDARAREIVVGEGGALTRIVTQSGGGVALSLARVKLAAGARFRQFVIAEGARLARIETHVEIVGEGAELELNGIYMVGDGRHADLTSVVTHAAPNANTRQLVRGVARRGGRGVFQGKIVVARGAGRTDARQHHKALMLEDGAEIDAKPELEIYADDVQCAHGNAIGALDVDQLFYLRSRGVPEARARAMLIEAFLHEALPENLPDDLYMMLLGRIDTWLKS